jgi:hypothetical protein
MEPVTILLLLVFGHLLADYPAQSSFLAVGKNARREGANEEAFRDYPWWYILGVHSGIHAGFVLLFTGSVFLCLAEFTCHFLIDKSKNERKLTFLGDQGLHIACKIVWWLLLPIMGTTPIIGP